MAYVDSTKPLISERDVANSLSNKDVYLNCLYTPGTIHLLHQHVSKRHGRIILSLQTTRHFPSWSILQ